MRSPRLERRARVLNGLPRTSTHPWWKRLLTSGFFWGTLLLAALSVVGLRDMYTMMHRDITLPDGRIAYGIPREMFVQAAKWAWPTAAVWSFLFWWLDRYRRLNVPTYVMAFLWGGCVSTWFSMYVNTWAGKMMGETGSDPNTGARAAVFSAPFVEELSKGAILFVLAIVLRYRFVSALQTVAIAGFSAIGFAFVENVVYYARTYNFATQVPGIPDPKAATMQLVMLRGVYTSFGHPLFTSMTAFGLAVGLRHRSKLVRVAASLAGFTMACFGHMLFNGMASTVPQERLKPYWFMALGLVVMIIIYLVGMYITEMRRLRARLTDYVRMGWLAEGDPKAYSSPWTRQKMYVVAALQPRRFPATWRAMHDMTELVYLRDGMVRGLIDEAGHDRARELISRVNASREVAVMSAEPVVWPDLRPLLRRIVPPKRRPAPVPVGVTRTQR